MTDIPAETIATTSPATISPGDILPDVIIAFLAPLFAAACGGDMQRARAAARATMASCHARNHTDMIAIGQIIACGLAALSSISRSMDDSLSASLVLRLRGNAVTLNRAAEQNRRVLRDNNPRPGTGFGSTVPDPDEYCDLDPTGIMLTAAPERPLEHLSASLGTSPGAPPGAPPLENMPPLPEADMAEAGMAAAGLAEAGPQAAWGAVMAQMAGEYAANLPHLPPAERRLVKMRASFLGSAANELLGGRNRMPAEAWTPEPLLPAAPSIIRPAEPGPPPRV